NACYRRGSGMSAIRAWRWFRSAVFLATAIGSFGIGAVSFAATSEARSADQRMTERVDALLAKRWKQAGVEPAPRPADADFLRPASFDPSAFFPTVTEVRDFLADAHPDNRSRRIDKLLNKPTHYSHLAATWRQVLLPSENEVLQFGGYLP